MIRFLSSMKLAFWSIILLIMWFMAGAAISNTVTLKPAFNRMNDMLMQDWIATEATKSPMALLWLVILCLFALLVLVSFSFCSFNGLYRNIRKQKFSRVSVVLFLLHIACILILVLHGLSMISGYKQGHLKAFTGQTINLENGFSLHIDTVSFVNDTEILKEKGSYAKIRLKQENFNVKENFAEFTLLKNCNAVSTGRAYFLSPYVANNLRFTVESFMVGRGGEVGIRFTVARIPLLIPFFIIYGMAVLLIFAYAVLTWKHPLNAESTDIQR